MKLSYVMILNSAAAFAYCLLLLIVPATILGWHGIAGDLSAQLIGRYFGVTLLGMGLISWMARNSDDSQARQAIVLGLLISNLAGLVLSLYGTISGQMNVLGWLAVAVYLLLTIGFGYFQFTK